MSEKKCIICGVENADALNILGRAICRGCESRILTTNANDSQYEDFLNRLRDVSADTLRDSPRY